ncbi:DUF5777 family beta-barrel protein [Kaistella sp. PBT33-4]|uniref:DUF5777 family beta-barrel protein n=1 Tax=Kaistella sp. PBT33-4 TaxID=3032000 RepID=UPI0023D820AC|nr:DUF5777 family beta-barrel protein [Kaistella sp. PBT33-4]MDF0720934.1 DUF5777 family beta-barrel protein [Kaistella sp. PBT33-4]
MAVKLIIFLSLLLCMTVHSQEDLLSGIDTATVQNEHLPSFKALQIVTGQSTKMAAKKEFYVDISHRFGSVSAGFKTFFGLDHATTKLGVIYGLTDGLSIHASRHTYQKTYELAVKYRLMKQAGNAPFEIVGYHAADINSELNDNTYPFLKFGDRMSYVTQILVSRRFSENLSLQLSPGYVHKNLINPGIEDGDLFSAGLGGRYKLSRRLSLNAEYFLNFDNHNYYKNPLSLGLDIDTGGHIFQLVFTNSQPNTETGYLTNATGNWAKGEVFFGFNLYRVF